MGQEVAIVTTWMDRNSYVFGKVHRITDRKLVISIDGKLREFSRVHGNELGVKSWNARASLMDPDAARRGQAMQEHRQQVKKELRDIKEELSKLAEYPLADGVADKLIELAARIKKFREE
jgi:predicted aminopeptidase